MQRVLQFEIKKRFGQGHIKNVLVKDLYILQQFPKGSDMTGLDENHVIDGVTFENVVIGGKCMTDPDDLGIILTPFVKNVVVK